MRHTIDEQDYQAAYDDERRRNTERQRTMSNEKTYLGDGCYATFDGNGIELTTENGIETTNRVYLEQQVYGALVQYHDRVTGKTTMGTMALPLTDADRLRMTEGSGAALARSMGQVITGPTVTGTFLAAPPNGPAPDDAPKDAGCSQHPWSARVDGRCAVCVAHEAALTGGPAK